MKEETLDSVFGEKIIAYKERLLLNLVKRIPSRISPNMMTIARALFIIPIYLAYRQTAYAWMAILFFLAMSTDLIDGIHARYYHLVTPIGKLLDPAADKIIFIGVLIMLAPGRLSNTVLYTIISLEALLVLLATVIGPGLAYFFHIKRKVGANNAGKIKLGLEGASILLLLLGPNSTLLITASEIVLWVAIIFAACSIILHIIIPEKQRTAGDTKT